MNINNLKYFYDAVESQSISISAAKNFITQSAVSQGILKLEKALKLDLITHHRNTFKLTPEGEVIYRQAQQLFGILKAMQDVAQEQASIISGQVNLSCTQSVAINLLSPLLLKLKTSFPELAINLKISKMDQICSMLRKGTMDLGLVVESDACEGFQKEEILKGNFHLYSKTGTIGEGVYVDHSTGLFVPKLMKLRKDMRIIQELDSWQLLFTCASQGIGCCFLPDFIANNDPTLKACDLEPIPYRIIAFYPQSVRLTRAAKLLIELLNQK